MQIVRIYDHGDGTYSAWIFSTCYVSHGTLAECERAIVANNETPPTPVVG
jgi:hypothetical protein